MMKIQLNHFLNILFIELMISFLFLSCSPTEFSIGGNINGLTGTVILQNNGVDDLTINSNGTFAFKTPLAEGANYHVTILTQPDTQICSVANGSGTVGDTAVTNVSVVCSINAFTVGGTITGLSETVVLQNNSGDNLTIHSDGFFTFSTPVAEGAAYNVTVLTQPDTQTCSISNGSGTVGNSAVTNVSVVCSTNTFTVGGIVTGLSGIVILQNNGGDDLTISSNGSFTFNTPVVGNAAVTNVSVVCSTNTFTVGGTVSGLSGTVVLQNNGGDNLTITSNGAFTFTTPVAEGATYNVTVLTQPATQTCVVTNGSGTVGASNVTNVNVSCTTNITTLSASVSSLALSTTGLTEYGVSGTPSSGLARIITLSNTGSYSAFNLSISYPTWPSGTTASSTCGSTLASGDSCDITVTPGNTATSDGTNPCSNSGTAPIAGNISISADNATTVGTDVVILSYGCIYQGGYIYALDDTTSNTGSVSGKVATTSNQSPGIIWSSNAAGTYDGGIAIYGISQTSTILSPNPSTGQVAGQTACNGATDGSCDTNNIYVYYQNNATGHPINTSFYASGLCKQTISSFSDWYLPSICELGYDRTAAGTGCGTSGMPTLQNMQSNLVDFNTLNLLSGTYLY